jgi:porin
VMSICTQANAADEGAVGTYSGDIWTRSTLTGDWGGTRDDLAQKGVTFDLSLTQIFQGVVNGGKDRSWEYGGVGNMTVSVDTQKLGLWPGGFFNMEVEGNYHDAVNLNSGAIMPVNSNSLYPTPGGDNLNIPALNFMQFFSEYAGVLLGKLDTTTGDANEFAHGKGDKQFYNVAMNINPVLLLTCPYSTLGAGVIILPTKDPNAAIVTLMAMDGEGKASTSGFDTVAESNTTYAVEGRIRTNFLGHTGHHLMGYTYGTKTYSSLSQNLRFIVFDIPIREEDSSWAFYYNFDQYLYEREEEKGIGIFGRFGASDGDANPVHYFYSLGLGGKGIAPSRPLDEFGVGFYYMDISNPTLSGPLTTRTFLRDEYGLEGYYNIALTPWMKLTPNIQVIRPAQKYEYDFAGGVLNISRKNIDTATILGLRLQVVF